MFFVAIPARPIYTAYGKTRYVCKYNTNRKSCGKIYLFFVVFENKTGYNVTEEKTELENCDEKFNEAEDR